MSRILKRPMFRRGGSSNEGIMTGLVDRKKYNLGGIDKERLEADTQTIRGLLDEYAPIPKTRLPAGEYGAELIKGKGFREALIDPYMKYTTADDKRRALIAKRDQGAVSTALSSQMKKNDKTTTKSGYNTVTGKTGFFTTQDIINSGGTIIPIPQGQVMKFNTNTGVMEMKPAGLYNQELENKDKAQKLGTQYQILEGFIGDMKLRLPETKTSAVGVGFSIVEGIADQVSQIAESLGVKDTLVIEDEEKLDNYLSSKGFTAGATSYQTMKGSAINLGYALAKIAEPDNPRLSEGDIIRQLNRINFGGSREVFAASLDQVLKEEGIRAEFEMKGLGGDLSIFDKKDKKKEKELKQGEDGTWRFE